MQDSTLIPADFSEFDRYLRQGEPSQREKAEAWRTAIGLQDVDGLSVSDYLKQTALQHTEGQITIDEVDNLIRTYYQSKDNRRPQDNETEEADKVSTNIVRLLGEQSFTFSVAGLASIHKQIFKGVFKHAGQFRKYDISKREWVLNGDSVLYSPWQDLNMTLAYDIDMEKQFDYSELNVEQAISHLASFVAGLWQIHPFQEGNTRTTAIFTVKYLRSIGFADINNDMFEQHSWYFRNALVRANYRNLQKGVNPDKTFLVTFFRNLLLNENTSLHNRDMHIAAENIQSATTSSPKCKNCTLEEMSVLRLIEQNPTLTQKQIAMHIGKSERTVKNITVGLVNKNIIRRVNGKRNGYWELT